VETNSKRKPVALRFNMLCIACTSLRKYLNDLKKKKGKKSWAWNSVSVKPKKKKKKSEVIKSDRGQIIVCFPVTPLFAYRIPNSQASM